MAKSPPAARAATAASGFRSDALRDALTLALSGKPAALETLLARHGGLPTARPNLRLAAAFGAEMATAAPGAIALLDRLTEGDAAAEDPRAFLPLAAAHGWAARLRAGQDRDRAWHALSLLAADHRAPVRLGTLDALATVIAPAGDPGLVRRARDWLADESQDAETRLGSAALVVEALGQARALTTVSSFPQLLEYLSEVLRAVAEAPRAADRWDARRRVLLALPRTLAAIAGHSRGSLAGADWLRDECARATHPQVRDALSLALTRLKQPTDLGSSTAVAVGSLQEALASSAKPPRDPTRIRPGKGRGRRAHGRGAP